MPPPPTHYTHLKNPALWREAKAFFFATVAACLAATGAALADETRISVGYGTIELHTGHIRSKAEVEGRGYWLRAEGDEGDFLYALSFGRHNASGSGVIPPSPPEIPTPLDSDLKYPDIETVVATLGWHGLYLGGLSFGPFVAYERVAHTDGTFSLPTPSQTFSVRIDEGTREQTVAGVLMRTETGGFDFSAMAGSIILGDAWENGLAMSIAADIHVTDAVTFTGDWTRSWGKQAVWEGDSDANGSPIYVLHETTADAFGLGGRVKVADRVFLEGWMTRSRNGTHIDFGQDNWITTMNVGIGTSF